MIVRILLSHTICIVNHINSSIYQSFDVNDLRIYINFVNPIRDLIIRLNPTSISYISRPSIVRSTYDTLYQFVLTSYLTGEVARLYIQKKVSTLKFPTKSDHKILLQKTLLSLTTSFKINPYFLSNLIQISIKTCLKWSPIGCF